MNYQEREVAVVVSNDNFNKNPIETIDAICEAGFKNVFIQWYDKEWEVSQEQQLNYVRDKGLNVIFAHLGYKQINKIWLDDAEGDELVESYINDLNTIKEKNIPMVVMHLTSKDVAPAYGEIGLNRFKKIVDYAESLNIKVAFENTKIKGYLDYVLSNITNSNCGICFDAGHCHAHFDDEFNWELYKDRIFAIHLHDNDKSRDQHYLPGDGTIDWNDTINKLKEANYNGPITLETVYSEKYQDISITEFYNKCMQIANDIKIKFN